MKYFFILIVFVIADFISAQYGSKQSKKMRCLNPPTTAKKVETYIKECQEEVKNKIVQEALQLLHESYEENHYETPDYHHYNHQLYDSSHPDDIYDNIENERHKQHKRRSSTAYHPTLVPNEDKRIAGCLLHCVYAKNNAIDKLGWPTLDGLVHFYSDGVNDHAFFMATLRAANNCLRAIIRKHRINRLEHPNRGQSCDLAFDVFDCISDQITEYCFDQYHPE